MLKVDNYFEIKIRIFVRLNMLQEYKYHFFNKKKHTFCDFFNLKICATKRIFFY